MSWGQRILIGFAVVSVLLASGVVYLGSRIEDFVVERGVSGAFLAARQAARLNDSESAGAFYAEALMARPGDVTLMREAMQAQVTAGQLDKALQTAQMIVDTDGETRQARLLLAVDAFKRGLYDEAAAHLNEMSRGPFTELLVPNIRLWTAIALQDDAARQRAVNRLSRGSVFASAQLVQAAQGLELAGQIDEARRYYERALRSGGARYLHMVLAYGGFMQRHGEAEKAEKLYDFYAERNLTHAHIEAARARLADGQPLRANENPQAGLAQAFAAIGEAMQSEGRTELALGFLRVAQHLNPSDDLIAYNVAKRLGELERYQRAAEQFAAIEESAVLYQAAQIDRAQMLFQAGANDAAIAVLQTQLKDRPENRDILISLGDLYRAEQRFDEAEQMYDRAIALLGEPEPRHWFLYFARGMMRERLDNWDLAEIDLQQARQLSGDEPNVLNYLGYSWIDQGIHLDEGLKIIRQAVNKEPKNGAFVDSLGWAYYRLGDYTNALKYLELASQLEAADAVITDHLGDALWRVGRKVEARYQWRKALAFDPTDEDRAKIETKLLSGLGAPEKKKPKAHMPRGGTAI